MSLYLKTGVLLAGLFISIFGSSQTTDFEKVKQNICDSHIRVLNNRPEVKERIAGIVKYSNNPDIMIRELKEGIDPETAWRYLHSQTAEGAWSDLNYNDKSRSGWSPSYHAERLLIMAKAYRDKNSPLYESEEMSKAIHQGLKFWFEGGFRCTNWWYNEIGVPKMMGAVFLLMENELDEPEKKNAIQYMQNSQLGRTGQNSVWLAENVLVRALLQNDEKLFSKAREAILKEIRINNTGEGIRPDMSFHQHGSQLQFGNYGLAFANTAAYWARIFKGTQYALSGEQLSVLRTYILAGMQWIVWKGYMDISSCGRQLFRDSQMGKALSYGKSLKNMMVADGRYANEYERIYKENIEALTMDISFTGNCYFPYSDFGVHRAGDWCATLKMSSLRVIGTEIVNSENLKGNYLGDGALYIYQKGDEYKDIFPVWDWKKLPGVTSADNPQLFDRKKGWNSFKNENAFVGGLSDGKTGIAAMILDKDSVSARKSYFFTPDAIICMGTGIKSTGDYPVTTSIAQCLKKGDAGKWEKDGKPVYYHDGIVYLFPNSDAIKYTAGKQSGNWKEIAHFYDTTKVEKEVFSLWIEHGKQPAGAEYHYVIIPSVSEKNRKSVAEKFSYKVIKKSDAVHAINYGKVQQIVFYETDSVEFVFRRKKTIQFVAENKCMVMISETPKGLELSVCDPLQQQEKLVFTISGEWIGENCRYEKMRGTTIITLDVSGAEGKTKTIQLAKRI